MVANWMRHLFFGHYTRRVTRKGVCNLIREIKPRSERKEMLRRIDQAAVEYERKDVSLATDPPSQGHLEWSSFILAAYLKLLPEFEGPDQTIEALGDAMEKAHATPMTILVLKILMKSFRGDVVRAGKIFDSILKQYGSSFAWEIKTDDRRLDFTILHCWYFHFFSTHGVPRLTTCACRLDGLWFNRMSPQRHGLRFNRDRYTTKGYGGENCIFPIELADRSDNH